MNMFWKLRHPCTPAQLSDWIITQYRIALPTARQEGDKLLSDGVDIFAAGMLIHARYHGTDILEKQGRSIRDYVQAVFSVLDALFLIITTEKDSSADERRQLFVDTLRQLTKAAHPYPGVLDQVKRKFQIIGEEISGTSMPDSSAQMTASLQKAGIPSHMVRAADGVVQRQFDDFKVRLCKQLEYAVLCHPQDQAFPVPDDPGEFTSFVRGLISASVRGQQ